MSILDVDNLQVRIGDGPAGVVAVDGLSYSLERGETLAIVGESGCGKSMSALALLGLVPRTATVGGSIMFEGQQLVGLSDHEFDSVRGAGVSMVFQDPGAALNPVWTIGHTLIDILRRRASMSKRAAADRALELLEAVGIPEPRSRLAAYPHQLSGGMKQRVVIAAAIATAPRLLVADEPTTALDVTTQAGILELLKGLVTTTETALLLITHDLGVVADIADNVIVMYAGQAVESGSVMQIFTDPRHPYTRGLIESVPRRRTAEAPRLSGIPGRVPVLRQSATNCSFNPRCSYASDICTSERPPAHHVAEGHGVLCWNHEQVGADSRANMAQRN